MQTILEHQVSPILQTAQSLRLIEADHQREIQGLWTTPGVTRDSALVQLTDIFKHALQPLNVTISDTDLNHWLELLFKANLDAIPPPAAASEIEKLPQELQDPKRIQIGDKLQGRNVLNQKVLFTLSEGIALLKLITSTKKVLHYFLLRI